MANAKRNSYRSQQHCRKGHRHNSNWRPNGREVGYQQKFVDAVLARDRRQIRMCLVKNRYASLSQALKALKECESKRGKWLKLYPCPYCKGYHLATRHEGDELIGFSGAPLASEAGLANMAVSPEPAEETEAA